MSARGNVADDALSQVLAHSVANRLPVLVTLNGGIWSDAAGTAPEWDLTDRLEEDRANCQWNERDEVMADHHLKDLPGSQAAPELARALTLNVYASEVRGLKRRNLQQAAQPIVAFMREHPDLFVVHEAYDSVSTYFTKFNRYTDGEAQAIVQDGRSHSCKAQLADHGAT